MEKLVITVAPTGSVPKKKNNPHVPSTPESIIKTGVRCEAAGAWGSWTRSGNSR